jgi:predicted helicase
LLPLADESTKETRSASQEQAIFKLYGNGVNTARDEWVVDPSPADLNRRIRYFLKIYNQHDREAEEWDNDIKWSRNLKVKLARNKREPFKDKYITRYAYRPFVAWHAYLSDLLIDELGQLSSFTGDHNNCLTLSKGLEFRCLATDIAPDFHFLGETRVIGRVRYSSGQALDNITEWGLKQFRVHYEAGKKSRRTITKDAIFNYVCGVLHDPVYREKYALNLKREFPRIPFYPHFWKWAEWGEKLMALHIGYETVEPWPLERIDAPEDKSRKAGLAPKAMLRANKDSGNIQLDSETQLTGIPSEAWTYRPGNRSALEWILDQYKEKTPKDPTIREKFNTYRFADHKEKVIDLLKRVTRVSVETVKTNNAQAKAFTAVDISAEQIIAGILADYIVRMGVDARFLTRASMGGPTEIYKFSSDEMTKFAITWNGLEYSDWILEPYKNGLIGVSKTKNSANTATLFCRKDRTLRLRPFGDIHACRLTGIVEDQLKAGDFQPMGLPMVPEPSAAS